MTTIFSSLPIFLSGSIVTYVFLLAFVVGIIYKFVR